MNRTEIAASKCNKTNPFENLSNLFKKKENKIPTYLLTNKTLQYPVLYLGKSTLNIHL